MEDVISNNCALQESAKCHVKRFFIFNFLLKTFYLKKLFDLSGFWWRTLQAAVSPRWIRFPQGETRISIKRQISFVNEICHLLLAWSKCALEFFESAFLKNRIITYSITQRSPTRWEIWTQFKIRSASKSEMRAWSRDLRAIRVPRINSERYRVVNCPSRLDYKMKLFLWNK